MSKRYLFITVVVLVVILGIVFVLLRPKVAKSPQNGADISTKIEDGKKPDPEVSIVAVGDIMLSRNVAAKIKEKNDINYPFLKTTDLLRTGDIVFANLECPITVGRPILTGEMTFHADPGAELSMKTAGFNIVSLANNHTPNFGDKGLLDTFSYLDGVGINHVGAGKDSTDAEQAVYIEKNGLRFAFLAYNDPSVVPTNYAAGPSHPGTNFMDIEKMTKRVKEEKAKADFVIVSMHSGIEYKEPNTTQINFAHAAIDAGADFIIGHHPHVIQRVEEYKGKLIMYSLGNFVFDQMFSLETRQSIITKTYFNKNGLEKIEFTPAIIDDYAQPRILDNNSPEGLSVLKRLGVVLQDNKYLYP